VRSRIEELDYLKQRKKSNRARFGKLVTDVKVSQKLSDEEPHFSSNDNSEVEQLFTTTKSNKFEKPKKSSD
jgi:hypothetical protein